MNGKSNISINKCEDDFIKQLRQVTYSRNTDELFIDFCHLTAYTIALPFYDSFVSDDLKRLHDKYSKEEMICFDKCFAILIQALDKKNYDFFGKIYGSLDMAGRNRGDYFTPYEISYFIAKMTLGDLENQLKEKPYLLISEPACGSGGMIIAIRQILIEQKRNPSWDIFIEARDISSLCFDMSYIQLSLYGLSAKIIHGDTLTLKTYKEFYTPIAIKLPWAYRFLFHSINKELSNV